PPRAVGTSASGLVRGRAGEELVSQPVGTEVAAQAGPGAAAGVDVIGVERAGDEPRGANPVGQVAAVDPNVVFLPEPSSPLGGWRPPVLDRGRAAVVQR